ncbi:MAG TPA: ABC transporter permease subunit [Planctomycetota bacterium]|jgi:hypothetical protein
MNEIVFGAIQKATGSRGAAIALVWIAIGLVLTVILYPGGRARRLLRQIFAVATLAFREGLRVKVLWTVFALALLVGLLAYMSDGDGTHAGRAAVVLNYGLSAGEFLGASLIVLLSALSVAQEIESRIMHTFGTKPVPRWAILLGKALGFFALDVLFLLGVVAMTAVLVRAVPLRHETRLPGSMITSGTWSDLRRSALTGREYLLASNEASKYASMKIIRPGTANTWLFNIDPGALGAEELSLKFQISSTRTFASHIENLGFRIGYQDDAKPLLERTTSVPQDRPFELYFKPEELKAGTLAVTLSASPQGRLPPSVVAGVKIGIPVDTLFSNLGKSLLLMALQGWVLALITTGWSGVLSFPVTIALGILLVISGELSRSALELMQTSAGVAQAMGTDAGQRSGIAEFFLNTVLSVMPDFRAAGGPTAFVEGNIVTGWAVAEAMLTMGVLRALAWAAPGVLLFHKREVGR